MRDTHVSDLDLDQLVELLAQEGPNDMQLVALADLVRRASDAEGLAGALQEALDYIGVEPEHADLDPNTPTFVHRSLAALARYRGKR